MIDKRTIVSMALVHGTFNLIVVTLFMYQGWLGWNARKRRQEKRQTDFTIVKRHRKMGPIMTVLGSIGYLAGASLVYLDQGRIMKYPLHFVVGSFITLAIITTFLISRKIKSPDSPLRTPHFVLGMMILCLYLIQVFLGLRIFF